MPVVVPPIEMVTPDRVRGRAETIARLAAELIEEAEALNDDAHAADFPRLAVDVGNLAEQIAQDVLGECCALKAVQDDACDLCDLIDLALTPRERGGMSVSAKEGKDA